MMEQIVAEDPRVGDWMQVFSGKRFWPLDPRAEEVEIEDIAHALSLMCRYNGHSRIFLSVAEHAWHVSHAVVPENALWGLMHDAAEAYCADVIRPIKRSLCVQHPTLGLISWSAMERRIRDAIADRFGMPREEPFDAARVDTAILGDEKIAVMNPCAYDWRLPQPPLGVCIAAWRPEMAERMFLARFQELTAS
jgi:hypothetical protein